MNSKNPFNFFDIIYCINLPSSTERWNEVEKQFKRVGINNRIKKIWTDPPPKSQKPINFSYAGEFGCSLSHMKIYAHAASENYNNILILEDDVWFNEKTENMFKQLENAIKELPKNWDILYLGGRPTEQLIKISDNIASSGIFLTTLAYAISRKNFISLFDFSINEISKPFPNACADSILSRYTIDKNSYCIYPPICTQLPGHSDIRNAHRDYVKTIENNWKLFYPK